MDKERTAVYAGSFDPPTNGHLWMIEQGSKTFDKLIVAVGINPEKKYTFSVEERLQMIQESIKDSSNINFDEFSNEFLVNYTQKIGADFILRGVRNSTDFAFEQAMNNVNCDINSNITTIFLMPPRELCEVSSSFVKGLIGPDGWETIVCQYVPKPVFDKIKKSMVEEKDNQNNESFSSKELLNSKWNDLCQRLNITDSQVLFDDINNHYSEPHRHYHTLNHINSCLQELETVKVSLDNPEAVELALWYHDIVYVIGKDDNEEKSAEMAIQFCKKNNLSSSFTKQVKDHILATKHTSPSDNPDSQYLADIDMAILGQPTDVFDKYEEQIYQEYSTIYSKADYQKGRISFLKTILENPIYTTDFFKNKYKQPARNNIESKLFPKDRD